MGYYIETDSHINKAKWIEKNIPGCRIVGLIEASKAMDDPDLGVVVVMDNLHFEAAGLAYDKDEFKAFAGPDDWRNKTFVVGPKSALFEAAGYSVPAA